MKRAIAILALASWASCAQAQQLQLPVSWPSWLGAPSDTAETAEQPAIHRHRHHHAHRKPAIARKPVPIAVGSARTAPAPAPIELQPPSFDERWTLGGEPLIELGERFAQLPPVALPDPARPIAIRAASSSSPQDDDLAIGLAALLAMLVGISIIELRRALDRWLHPADWKCPPILDLNATGGRPC